MIKCTSSTKIVLFIVIPTLYSKDQIERISFQIVLFDQMRRPWIQRGQVITAPDLKSRSDYELDLFQVVSGSTPRLLLSRHSQLVCLLPVGILNLLSLFK